METFPCTAFTFSTKYPESGTRMDLGNSYDFVVGSPAPDQRIFMLTLPGLGYFVGGGGAISRSVDPWRNMAVLDDFYLDHKLAKSFFFDHPVYGQLVCRFNSPLEIPEGIPGGTGVLNVVQVQLVEVP